MGQGLNEGKAGRQMVFGCVGSTVAYGNGIAEASQAMKHDAGRVSE
jgi:hypothetical protein